jgi:hypothetical protein
VRHVVRLRAVGGERRIHACTIDRIASALGDPVDGLAEYPVKLVVSRTGQAVAAVEVSEGLAERPAEKRGKPGNTITGDLGSRRNLCRTRKMNPRRMTRSIQERPHRG